MEKGKSSFACQKLAPSALSYRDGRRRRHCFSPSTHMAVCGEWRKEEGRGGGGWELFNVSPSLIKALPPSSPSHFLCLLGGLGWGKKCVVGGGREGGRRSGQGNETGSIKRAEASLTYKLCLFLPPPFLLRRTPPSRAKDTRLSSAQKNGPRGSKSSSIYSLPPSPVFAELFCCGAFSGTVDSILD